MKLKLITKLLIAIFSIVTLSSCNDDSTQTISGDLSHDAQIYSFSLSVDLRSGTDSANFLSLKKTRFAIDQFNKRIYNPDSLPYQTVPGLKSFSAKIGFSPSSPSKIELDYRTASGDSTVVWNGTDSIDFSTPGFPKIRVYAANGNNKFEYTVDIRVHKIDMDLINWVPAALKLPTAVSRQKTLLNCDTLLYTFSIDGNGSLNLYTALTSAATYDLKGNITGIAATDIDLQSITLLNGKFYAKDKSNNGYISTNNGLTWTNKNSNTHAILGVLPKGKTAANDLLLVLTKGVDNKYYLATTVNLVDLLIMNGANGEPIIVPDDFPISGFASVTNFDRNDLNSNILSVTGGKSSNGNFQNKTWLFQFDSSDIFRYTFSSGNNSFLNKDGIVSFRYNNALYVLTNNVLYKSIDWGSKWVVAPAKEALNPEMPKASGQSVIVDSANYIWVFGGITELGTTPKQVWRGRLNKLNPKK